MTARLFVVPLLCLALQTAGQPPRPEPQYFRYQRPIALPPQTAAGQTCVALDTTVFMHATSDLSDIRLFSDAREIPYALLSGIAQRTSTREPISPLNLGVRDGHIVFDARVNAPSYATVELTIDKQNFIATVDVSGSESTDANGATTLGSYTIFDLTGQQLGRSTVLHLPPSTFPYLHFEITGALATADVKGATVVESPAHPLVYRTVAESQKMSRRGRESIATFDLPARVPVDRVEFIPAAGGNFSRTVSITTADRDRRAPPQGTGTIARIHIVQGGRKIDQEQYTVDVADELGTDTGRVQWTAAIDNGDDAPLAIHTVRLQMRERTMCFDAAAGDTYTLYYGDTTLAAPRYDYATLFQPHDSTQIAALAPETPNATVQQRADTRPFTERHPALLWGALVIVVGVLGGVAVRTASRVQPPNAT